MPMSKDSGTAFDGPPSCHTHTLSYVGRLVLVQEFG